MGDRNEGDRRNRKADGRQRRSERKIEAGLQPVGARGAKRRKSFRQQHQGRDDDADHRFRHRDLRQSCFDGRGEKLRKADDRDKGCKQKTGAGKGDVVGRRRRMLLLVVQKIVAVAHRLDENEGAVENERHDRGEDQLRRVEDRAGRTGDHVRQDQRQRRQCGKDRKRCTGACDLKSLLVMACTTPKQANSDNAVADDHDGRKNGITCQSHFFRWRCEHDRDDQRRLDDRHRKRQHQCAERFAGAVRDHFGVIHGSEYGCDENSSGCGGHEHARSTEQRCQQNRAGQNRPCPGPPGNAYRGRRHNALIPAAASSMPLHAPAGRPTPQLARRARPVRHPMMSQCRRHR